MADLRKLLTFDEKKVEEGVWFPFVVNISFLIRSASSKHTRDVRREAFELYRAGLRDEDPDVRVAAGEKVDLYVLSHSSLAGWKNIDENGEPYEYSVENAEKMLAEFRMMYDFVQDKTTDLEPYRPANDVAAVKN